MQTGSDLPAFPTDTDNCFPGLTIRDYFAAKALQSLITMSEGNDDDVKDIVVSAYGFADAMLMERAK